MSTTTTATSGDRVTGDYGPSIAERLRKYVNDRGGSALHNGAWAMMIEAADALEAKERQLVELAGAAAMHYRTGTRLVRQATLEEAARTCEKMDAINSEAKYFGKLVRSLSASSAPGTPVVSNTQNEEGVVP